MIACMQENVEMAYESTKEMLRRFKGNEEITYQIKEIADAYVDLVGACVNSITVTEEDYEKVKERFNLLLESEV